MILIMLIQLELRRLNGLPILWRNCCSEWPIKIAVQEGRTSNNSTHLRQWWCISRWLLIFNIEFSCMILSLYIEIKLQRYFGSNCSPRSLTVLFLFNWLLSILVSIALGPLQGRRHAYWCLRNHLGSILRINLQDAIDINNQKLPVPMVLLGF